MARLEVVLDPQVGVASADLASAWNDDQNAHAVGQATVGATQAEDFGGVLDSVIIPLAVGLGVNGITALLGSVIAKLRKVRVDLPELEIVEMTRANGDRVAVVRLRQLSK